jgi:drug/metabolite transporter (DMT)-like permease
MCLCHAYLFEARPFVKSDNLQEFMLYMLLMMFVQNIIAYNLHAYLLQQHTATLIALASFVMPLMTAVMGYALLSEQITRAFFICSAGVALGLFVFYEEDFKKYRLGKL